MVDRPAVSPLADRQHPHRIYLGGVVRTMVGAGRATAFAVRDGRFVAVGSDADIESLAGPHTASIDLGGRVVLPGFIETHVHPHMSGASSVDVDAGAEACPDIESLIGALTARAATSVSGEAVRASGFDDSLVADDRGLTFADLDRAAANRPIVVRHLSGHGVYVNSFVLQAKEIDGDTPDPEGGVIVRDAAGRPTGEFREIPAMRLVLDPSETMPPAGELDDSLRRALARMASVGVTSFHDMFVTTVMADSYRRLHASGELVLRGRLYAGFGMLDGFALGDSAISEGDDVLSVGGVKLISDGSIQLHTGALSEPYHDLGGCHCGDMAIPPGDLDEMVARCHAAGRQVAIHTNGDRAIDVALDAIEKAIAASGDAPLTPPALQHRLEHVQTLREDQILRMRELGVAASVFVNHVYFWGDRHRDRFLGPHRGSRISPLASIAAADLQFALHCDSPVTPVDPLFTIHTAVNRVTRGGRVLGPEQRIDAETAVAGYTTSAARLGAESAVKGAIAPGLLADFVVLGDDPLACDPSTIKDIEVLATVVGDRVVYTAGPDLGSAIDGSHEGECA